MKISELVKNLNEIKETYGDVDVVVSPTNPEPSDPKIQDSVVVSISVEKCEYITDAIDESNEWIRNYKVTHVYLEGLF